MKTWGEKYVRINGLFRKFYYKIWEFIEHNLINKQNE